MIIALIAKHGTFLSFQAHFLNDAIITEEIEEDVEVSHVWAVRWIPHVLRI